jgi:hypothetical protein
MNTLIIAVPEDRTLSGTLRLEDAANNIILGPWPVASGSTLSAMKAGSEGR